MVALVNSCGLVGIQGQLIMVEVDMAGGLPSYDTVGLPDKAVTESRERIRSAIRNSGMHLPPCRITVNLAPADLRKEGTVYDLPIALGILAACGVIESDSLSNTLFVGELALDGGIRPIHGALSMALTARENGIGRIVAPVQNADEAAFIEGIEVLPASTLRGLCDVLQGKVPPVLNPKSKWMPTPSYYGVDFEQIRGQYAAKRAAEVAAAGGHNMLLVGPPGGGKTMMARAIPSILPDLSFEEAMEVTRIHSAAGRLDGKGLVDKRPFFAPHHSASSASLVGGGSNARPGEISMSHLGVLFLDEMPEFPREVLEALRQPMEDGVITIARVQSTATYPARFMLVGAMNPCPCGNAGSKTNRCTCPPIRIQQYKRRLSGPLLDRIDIFVGMDEVKFSDLHGKSAFIPENSATIRARVNACRAIENERFKGSGLFCNAHMTQKEIEKCCTMTEDAKKVYEREFDKRNFSGRGNARALRLARTVADLDASELIREEHISEALQYRTMDKYWS